MKIIKITPSIWRAVKRAISAALEYERLTGRNLGITGEVGELLVCHKLRLKLMTDPRTAGYDAIDKNRRRYQIKTRRANNDRGSISTFSKHDFDCAVLATLDENYKIIGLWRISHKKLRPILNRRKRRDPSLREFKRISERLL